MIDVKGLSKSFGNHLVLDNIDQHISPGEKVVVIGPSGSGKSTFLRCLNLLEQPTAGTITFDGVVITDPRVDIDAIRRQMGMVFQHFNLFPNMTIRRNITLAPVRTGLMKQEEADAEAAKLLERVGLTEKADSYPAQLSGGQKQRIAIAGVIAMEPRCIVLDEPTAMLDPIGRADVLRTIKTLNRERGVTVVLITHHMDEAAQADRLVVMAKGRIVADGAPKEVFQDVEGLKSVGLTVPDTTELLWELRREGLDVPLDALSDEECAQALKELLA
mgnify:CR=1 FL=1